jgi:hypothetical protein
MASRICGQTYVNSFSKAPAFGGILILWPTANSRSATASHSRDAVASSMVKCASEALFLRLYLVISTSIGADSPTSSSRTRIRFFFVSMDNSVISPIPLSLLLIAKRAPKASVASFERRRNVRTSLAAGILLSWRCGIFLSAGPSCCGRYHSMSEAYPPRLSTPERFRRLRVQLSYRPESIWRFS